MREIERASRGETDRWMIDSWIDREREREKGEGVREIERASRGVTDRWMIDR